jgi:hypothetical protein
MQQPPSGIALNPECRLPARFEIVFAKHDVAAESARTLDFERRGAFHHHDLRVYTELACRVSGRLREIAGRRGHHAVLPRLIEIRQHGVERRPDLERIRRLQRLEF